MNKATQQIMDILTACGCKPAASGNTIKVNAPVVNDAKKGDRKK